MKAMKMAVLILAMLAPTWPVMVAASGNNGTVASFLVPFTGSLGLDKTGTTGGMNNSTGLQVFTLEALASHGSFLTERTGFEPVDELSPVTGLANRRFRPLSHLSK